MIKDFVKLARPGDWTKNLFIIPALIYSGQWRVFIPESKVWELEWAAIGRTLGAFLAFSLLASAIYAVNDTLDAEKDRLHPVKRTRPVASGAISPAAASTFALLLAVSAFALSIAIDPSPPWLTMTLVMYIALQVAYNAGLKRIMLLDVMALSTGFVIRALAGGAAVPVRVSLWLVLCVFFLCLYLGFIKRMCDYKSAERDDSDWTSPAGYDKEDDISWLLCFSGVMAILTYILYALSPQTGRLFGHRSVAFVLMVPIPVLVMHRMYMGAKRGKSDSPLGAIKGDPLVILGCFLFAALTVVVLSVPGLDLLLQKFFLMEN
ncbi:MAG: UbiA prenyltransferase family protein [Phycisphaerales bacterium JB038]